MPTSQNGWPANDRTLVASRLIPGTGRKVTVRTDTAGDLLLWVASHFHAEVEPIDGGELDDWGYAERDIRGSAEVSNHASGTAIDLNATRHPLGQRSTFTPAQVARIRAIVAATRGTVRWGGDYSGRVDEMHFEINAGPAAVEAAWARLSGGFLLALTEAEQREILDGIRKLKPGIVLPTRYKGSHVQADDHFGASLNAWAEAAEARTLAEQALAEVRALRKEVAPRG